MSSKFIFAVLCSALTLVNASHLREISSKQSSETVSDIDSIPVPEVTVGFECYHFNICTFQEIVGRHFNVPNQDPTIYVQCTVMRCPNGLAWDTVAETCNHPPTGVSKPDSDRPKTEEKTPEFNSASITTQQTTTTLRTTIPTTKTQTTISPATSIIPTLPQGSTNLQPTTERTNVLIMRITAEGSISQFFYRTWNEYQQGFGTLDSLYWIGLDKLHDLSQSGCAVRFDLQDDDGSWYHAQYSTFVVGGSADNYRLFIGGYAGNASDAMTINHNNTQFSTYDGGPLQGCANGIGGGWWYNDHSIYLDCCTACLTSTNNPIYWVDPNDNAFMIMPVSVEIRFAC